MKFKATQQELKSRLQCYTSSRFCKLWDYTIRG